MSVRSYLAFAVSVLTGLSVAASTYSGNGNTSFGGPIGLGTLTLTDNGTTVSGVLTKGANGFNDVLVIYIDPFTPNGLSSPGFSDTSGFSDANDGLRSAISGFTATGNGGGPGRSLLSFGTGFRPNYAIALGPASDNFGGLFGLVNGGNNSLNFINSVNLSPTGNNNSPTYTFTFNLSDIGLTPGAGQSFRLMGSYISDTGFRSGEALPGDDAGAVGWNPFLETQTVDYTTTAVPEPSTLALFGLSGLALAIWRRRSA